MAHCTHCQNPLPADATFCNQCRQLVGAGGASTVGDVESGQDAPTTVLGEMPPPGAPRFTQPEPEPAPGGGTGWASPTDAAPSGTGSPPPPPAGWGAPPPPLLPPTPGYGYGPPPAYGAAGWYGAPPSAGTNGLAIASLVCSVLGLFSCGVTGLVGVILGHVSLSQLKRTGQQGKGLAIAGLVIGYLSMAMLVLVIVLAVASEPNTY